MSKVSHKMTVHACGPRRSVKTVPVCFLMSNVLLRTFDTALLCGLRRSIRSVSMCFFYPLYPNS